MKQRPKCYHRVTETKDKMDINKNNNLPQERAGRETFLAVEASAVAGLAALIRHDAAVLHAPNIILSF